MIYNSCGACNSCNSCNSCSITEESGFCDSCSSCNSCSMTEEYGFCASCDSCSDGGINYNYKPLKSSKRNVEDTIWDMERFNFLTPDEQMGVVFVKLDNCPPLDNWKHCCMQGGVLRLTPNVFYFEDGATISYVRCNYCNKVHFHIEKNY